MFGNKIVIKSFLTLVFVLFFGIFFSFVFTSQTYADAWYVPTSTYSGLGTAQNKVGTTAAAAEGVNIGDVEALISDDNYHWGVASTTTGINIQANFANVSVRNANTFIIQTEFDLDATAPNMMVQICDFTTGTSVDNGTDAQCTTGGWRTLNNRKVAITTATATAYQWNIYDGYFTNGSNTAISTPLSNFLNSGSVTIRLYAGNNTTSLVNWDYVRLQAVVAPVYMPGGFNNSGVGTVTNDYSNATTITQGASDNTYITVAGTAGSVSDFYFIMKNVKPFIGANSIVVRTEVDNSACTVSVSIQMSIRNHTSGSWTNLGSSISCTTTDTVRIFALNNINLTDYISATDEVWIRYLGSANSTASINVDYAYMMIGATNTDTAKCEISFGTNSAGDCANTRTLDSVATASTWNVTSEDESGTMSHYYYPQDNGASNATTEEATSVHTKIKAQAPGNGKVVGMYYSGRFMSGAAGTVTMSLRDNSAAIATTGGFTDIGGGATTALTYTDNITVATVVNGAMAGVYNSADRYVNNLTGEVWLRLRTSTVGATSNNSVAQVDFLMVSLAWSEDSTKVTRTNTYSATNGTAITGTAQNITSIVSASNEGVNTGSYRGTFANDDYHWALASTTGGMKINLEFGNISLHNANVIILETEFDGDTTSPATLVQVCDFVSSTNVDTGTDSECTTGGWRTLNNLKATVAPTTATAYHFRIYDGYFSNGNTTVSTPLTNFIDSNEKILIRYYSTTNTTTVFAIDFARIMVEVNPVYTAAGFTNIGTGTVTNNYTYTSSVMQGAADNSKLTVAGTAGSVPDFYISFKNVKTQSWMNTIVVRSESACSTNFNYNYYIYNFTTTTYTAIGAQVTCTSTTDVAYPIALNNITISDYVSNGEIRVEMKGTTNTASTINLDYMYVMVGATNTDSGASECFISFGTVSANTCTNTRDLTNGTAATWNITTEDEAANQGHNYYGYDRPNNATAEESQSNHVKFSTTLDDNTEQVGIYYAARFMSGTAGTVSMSIRDNFGIVSAVGGFVTMGTTATTALAYMDNVSVATATGSPGGYSGFANTEDTYVNTDTDKMWMRMFTTTGGATSNNSVGQWDFAFVSIAWVETSKFDISGTVYSNETGTNIDCSTNELNLSVYVDDEFAGGGWCTASDGTYTVSNVYAVLGDKTTAIEETIYIDGHTEKAATFTRDDAVTNLTGIDLIQNRVILRQDDSGPITNSDIAHADSAEDSDLQFTESSGALSVTSGSKLIVETGDTFTPGGNVTSDSLEVKGTFSPTSNTVTLNGVGTSSTCTDAPGTVMPFCINGGTFNASTSTVNYIAVAATATKIENTTYNILQVDATSDTTAAVTFTLDGDTTVTSVLTIGNTGSTNTDILDGGVNTITLSGSGTPFDITSKGSFTPNFSTVNYTGSSATTVLLTTYYNLGIYPGANSINHTLGTATSQTLTVGGNLDLGNGTNTGVGILGNTYNPTINVTGNTSIKASTTFTSTSGTLTISGSYSNAGTFTHNSGTVNMNGIGTTDPTLYWNYSENTGTTINSRVGGGQGGTTSGTAWTSGVYDYALDYNGSDRTYSSNRAISATDNFTLMAWVNVTSLPQASLFIYNGDDSAGYGLGITNGWDGTGSELVALYGNVTWYAAGFTMPTNKWLHITLVRDSGTSKFYVNGVQTSGTFASTPGSPSDYFEVGNEPGQGRYFNGKVDEPKVYNYALTAAQIKSSMYTYYANTIGYTMSGNMTTTSSFNNLTFNGTSGLWDFGANSATVANDLTITNGTVIAPSTTLTVTGNYSNSGTFTHNSGTVLFNATDSGNTIAGTLSSTSKFYNLTFNGIPGAWSFTSNPAVEVANDLTITNGTVTSTSGNLTITGNYSNSATFTNNSGTVIMNATDSGNTLAGTLSGTSKFYNLTFNGVSGDWSFTSNPAVEVANDLTITNGTLTSTSHASGLIVTGNYSNSGTFTHNSGTVIFNATDAGNTLAGTLSGSSSFYNITFSGASGAWSFTSNPAVTIANALSISNGTLTATSGTTTIGGNFTKTGGTFTHNSGTVEFNDNTKISTLTYNADITFSAFTVSTASKQMKFDNVDKTTVSGTFTINGSACGTKVELHSDSDTNQFDIDATGTVSVTYADIQDSNAITGLSATNSVAGGGGNNTGWSISGGACAPAISVTGVCYAFDESTGCGDTGTITIAFGNSLQAQTEPTVSSSWTVTGLSAPSTGTIVTIFIDGATDTDEAIAVTKYDGAGDITGVKLYKENLTIGSLDNQTLSNSELGTYDNSVSGDEDIFFDVTTNNLVVDATAQSTTEKLTIVSGNTHQPGGTITTHDLTNLGTFLPQANTITIQGSYLNSGTLTSSTSQFNMTGTTSETLGGTLSGATGKFYNLTFNGSGGAWSFTSNPAVEVANDLFLYGGTVTSTSSTLTIGNNYEVYPGVFTHNSGTVIFNATDSGNTIAGRPESTRGFYNLTFDGVSGAWTLIPESGYLVTVANNFTITNGTVTSVASPGWLNVSGNYSNSGTFTHNSGTIRFDATDSGNTLAGSLSSTSKFYNLTFSGSGGAWSFTSNPAVEVANNFTISNGTVTSTSSTLTITGNYSNSGIFTHNSGTLTMNATDSGNTLAGTLSGTSKFYNLTFNGSSGAWSFTSNPAVEVANDLTITNGTLTSTSHASGLTVTGNFSNSGTFTNNSGTVIMNATDSGNTLAGTMTGTSKFYNLTFDGVSGDWSFTSNPAVEVNNNLTITNGTVTSTSGNLTVTGNYSNAATFTHNSGTLIMNATDTGNTLAGTLSGSSKFYNLTFNGVAGAWSFTSNPAVEVNNDLTITNGTVTSTSHASGLIITGNYSNSGTFKNNLGTVIFNATDSGNTIGGTLSGTTGKFYNLTFNGSGGAWSFTSNPTVEINNDMTITLGNVTSTSGNLVIGGNYSNSGTFTHNSGTTIFNGDLVSNTLAGTLSGSSAFYNLKFDKCPTVNSPIGYWNFEEGTGGTTADNCANGFTGTLGTGGTTPTWTTGKYGNGLSFDGNDFVNMGAQSTLQKNYTDSFSFSSWINTPALPGAGTYPMVMIQTGPDSWSGYFQYSIYFNGDDSGKLCVSVGVAGVGGNSVCTVSPPSTNTWYHVMGVYNGTDLSMYVDGSYVNYATYSQGFAYAPAGDFIIGGSNNNFYYTGKIDNPTVYDYVLTPEQVVEDMNRAGGGWSYTSNPNVDVANNFTITNGIHTSTSGNLTISNNYSNSGTFTHNSGTVTMNATDAGNTLAGTMSGSPGKFYNLTFNGSGGTWSFTSNPAVEVANDFTITLGTVTSTSNTLTISGNYSNSGTFTNGSGTLFMNATDSGNTLAGTLSGSSKFYNLSFNGSGGTWSFTSNPAVEVANNFFTDNGNVTLTSNVMTVTGNFTSYQSFTHNSGTVKLNATDSGNTITGVSGLYFYNLTFDGIGGIWTSSGFGGIFTANDFTITNGTYNADGSGFNNIGIAGNYSNNGIFVNNGVTVIFQASDTGNTISGTLSGSNGKFYDLSFAGGTSAEWSFASNPTVEISNDLAISQGTLTSTSGNMIIGGNYSRSGSVDAKFTHNNGTVTFNSTSSGKTLAGTLSGTYGKFYNLTFNGSGGAWSFSSNPAVEVANNFTINAGTVTSTNNASGLTIGGNFTKTGGTFTHNSGKVIFNDNTKVSTLTYNADTTFSAFTVSTASKQMKFDNINKTIVVGTFTINGAACGTFIQLYSDSTGNQFDIDLQGTVSIDYADIKDSNAITAATANNSNNSLNNTNWTINGGSCNSAPNSPTSLAQKTTGDVVITTGGWNNTTSIKFTATADDPNNPDTIYLCVEYQQLGTGFTNTETGCGTGVAYSGTPVTVTVTLNSIPDAFEYHWQARLKDTAAAYSSWVSYDVNAESARDYGIDTTAPTLSTINDGTSCGSDITFNNGSLSTISACWAQATATVSGLTKYQYSVGTTAGATDVLTWTDLVDGSANVSLTINSLTLQTSQQYYINVKAIDNATNTSGVISTNGQLVAPTISFSLNSSAVTFDNLNGSNSYTDTKTSTLTTSTNAYNGYVVRAYKTQLLTNTSNPSYTIPDFSGGSYAAPSAWSGTGYGYTSSDTSIQGVGKFPSSGSCLGSGTAPCYAPFSSTAPGDIVADHTATVTGSPISSEQFTVTYKVATPATQAGGQYTTTIVYTIVPQY